ncbi:NUDIX domain-containing protein [Deinococcus deserti]|uniref:Putative NUDIX hydrolase n=1 Tax=Deinococcus deserti (strain DSM 17065 / CIP 109153 / LMG 22923 / VCD115) TaxID=546414 RepID=C1D102_DEIDV|nr:NUDIX domain-containing protein [Deinococcus deserti]ACO45526.1 putative NUDIX hydrolase [Deinococcus deserti VCD115]
MTTGAPELQGYSLPLAQALALPVRQRALAYVTRGQQELLVFEHTPEYPDAGVQVPAGGVEAGEGPAQAAVRELFEETGLPLHSPVHIASFHLTRAQRSQVYHFFWLRAPLDTPDAWAHRVTSGDGDHGMTFLCRFAPLDHPELIPDYGYEIAIPLLKLLLKENP